MGKTTLPRQEQARQPGKETQMTPPPESEMKHYRGSEKLLNKTDVFLASHDSSYMSGQTLHPNGGRFVTS